MTCREVSVGGAVKAEDRVKYVLTEGSGALVQRPDTVYYRSQWRTADGQLLKGVGHDHHKADKALKMHGMAAALQGLDKVVLLTMKRGEVCYVETPQELFAAHDEGSGALAPGSRYVRLEVRRINRARPCPGAREITSFPCLLECFEIGKEAALELMEEKEFIWARDCLRPRLPLFESMPRSLKKDLTEEQERQTLDAIHFLHLNLGRCLMKKGSAGDEDATKAVEHFRGAIKARQDSPEAFYELGVAQAALGEEDRARESLMQAVSLGENNTTFRARHDELLGGMLGRLGGEMPGRLGLGE